MDRCSRAICHSVRRSFRAFSALREKIRAAPLHRIPDIPRAGDLAAVALAPIAPKGFAWRRPRHTLKGRQDAAAVAARREPYTKTAKLQLTSYLSGSAFSVPPRTVQVP